MSTEARTEPTAVEPGPRGTAVEDPARIERDRRIILAGRARGPLGKLGAYTRLSGPGWLQSAITLGGGSLAGSLYLGVLAGYNLMWLQPLAMMLGVVMLSAIGYVALSTGERPFRAINRHINPVLGWGWAVATLMANLVWCMPQFGLGTAALRQNLFPGVFSAETIGSDLSAKVVVVAILFVVASIVVWSYDSGGRGIKFFELLLKLMVAVIVVCFFGVVVSMAIRSDGLPWNEIFAGFVPNPQMLFEPAPAFESILAATGDYADYWRSVIVAEQRGVMITAAATAVGINMTFLLPYSMLARGWDRDFRGLGIFDLSTGLFVPFVLATSCVVIASASRFHAEPAPGFLGETNAQGQVVEPPKSLAGPYQKIVDARLAAQLQDEGTELGSLSDEQLQQARQSLPEADRRLAAMIIRRDAFDLANALEPLTGKGVAQYAFGIGVVGMALSTIIILMLINGFVICEMLGLPAKGTPRRLGALVAAFVGALGPFVWHGEAQFWLAVPTSMFGMVLLPVAYFTFFAMMNSRRLLGENIPRGRRRFVWNTLMGLATAAAAFGCFGSIWSSQYRTYGFSALGAFIALAFIVHLVRGRGPEPVRESGV